MNKVSAAQILKAKLVNFINDIEQDDAYRNLYQIHTSREKLKSKKITVTTLANRMELNKKLLLNFYSYSNLRAREYFEMNSSGRWIIENREDLVGKANEVTANLHKKFLATLPKSKSKKFAGLPRVYELVCLFLSKHEKNFQEKDLIEYFKAYQEKNILTLDEIFSMPVFFSFILIDTMCDNLWYILKDALARIEAHTCTTATQAQNPRNIKNFYKHVRTEGYEFSIYFFIHLQKHQDISAELTELVQLGNLYLKQHKDKVRKFMDILHNHSVSRSMRKILILKELDWDLIFKGTSIVHKILSEDPVRGYQKMDIASKSIYLDELKRVSRTSRISEVELAEAVISLAKKGKNEAARHVGYYIVDDGRRDVEKFLGKRLTSQPFGKISPSIYMLQLVVFVLCFYIITFSLLEIEFKEGVLLGGLLIVPVYMLVKQIIDTVSSRFTEARKMPRLYLPDNVGADNATMFVVPSFLGSYTDIQRLSAMLETVYLGNRGENIYYSLLLDYKDSDIQTLPGDKDLLVAMQERLRLLNKKYGYDNKFSFFVRERVWSEAQGKWMGWERKRGKILEFLNFIRKNPTKSPCYFSLKTIPYVKYMLTVDEDTVVTKDFINEMTGTISHPLNKAVHDADGKLLRGSVILQPRVDFSFTSKNQSILSKQLCDARGFDFYSQFLHELNYDLFAEGHYTGKGIIEIDSFLRNLNNAFQDDTILSHDLLEGAICGTAYSSDLKIYEGFPSTVRSYMMRDHRWDRGNWQIINWVFGSVKDRNGTWRKNPLTTFQKFKVLDNLISSLLHPSLFFLLVFASFDLISHKRFVFMTFFLFVGLLNMILGLYFIISKSVGHFNVYYTYIDLKYLFRSLLKRNLFDFLIFPYGVYLKLDAMAKALWRRFFSHKNTLEWTTFTASEGQKSNEFRAYSNIFLPVWLLLLVLFAVSYIYSTIYLFNILLLIWLAAPIWIYFYDKKMKTDLNIQDYELLLKKTALDTWHFFDTYTNTKTNHLPPDNVQGKDVLRVSTYTSITNIGFYLLSIFSAYDLGYISMSDFFERLRLTSGTLQKLETARGHYYNWYDLESLAPSRPWFVSSVDSGNFLACVVTLLEAVQHVVDNHSFNNKLFSGLNDIINQCLAFPCDNVVVFTKLSQIQETLQTEVKNIQEAQQTLLTLEKQLNSFALYPLDKYPDLRELLERFTTIYGELRIEIDEVYPNFKKAKRNKQISALITDIDKSKTFRDLQRAVDMLELAIKSENAGNDIELLTTVTNAKNSIQKIIRRKDKIGAQLEDIIDMMEFSFLYHKKKGVMSIGYKVRQRRVEPFHYGILATEARLAVFLSIAKNDVPKKSWKALDRKIKQGKKGPFLMAWSGTMFEYFMPNIFMGYSPESVYHQTMDSFLYEEMRFAKQHKVPWGFSESMYNELTPQGKYKYKAFGLADAAQNPNADKRLVVSPYSSFMSMHHDFSNSMKNVEDLIKDGGLGNYGFFEAIDYSHGNKPEVVYAYMAHHQGMILTALNNVISSGIIRKLFHTNKMVRSVSYLLEENRPGKIEEDSINLKNLRYIRYEY